MTEAERFWAKVERGGADECWLWKAYKVANGYGQFKADNHRRSVVAHRFAYELLIGPIPEGQQLDHLCRNRACVNPAHLEPVTPGENTRRGRAPMLARSRQRAKTHCPAGHPYAGDNLYVRPNGDRKCRACRREGMQLARA
jgi:hypothetical protein